MIGVIIVSLASDVQQCPATGIYSLTVNQQWKRRTQCQCHPTPTVVAKIPRTVRSVHITVMIAGPAIVTF
eukprot:580036-Hanusia_phi.AAC.1